MAESVTFYDRVLNLVKDHPVLATLLLAAVAIVGVGELIGSWRVIGSLFDKVKGQTNPDCRFVVVDSYFPGGQSEVRWATYRFHESKFEFDGGDIMSARVFMFKQFDSGAYSFSADMEMVSPAQVKPFHFFKADIELGESKYYRVKWSPATYATFERTSYISIAPVGENEFKRVSGLSVIPGCLSVRPGITML